MQKDKVIEDLQRDLRAAQSHCEVIAYLISLVEQDVDKCKNDERIKDEY